MKVKSLSRVCLVVTPWTAAYQAPPSMEFSKQEYWSGVPLPSPINALISLIMKNILQYISNHQVVYSKFIRDLLIILLLKARGEERKVNPDLQIILSCKVDK